MTCVKKVVFQSYSDGKKLSSICGVGVSLPLPLATQQLSRRVLPTNRKLRQRSSFNGANLVVDLHARLNARIVLLATVERKVTYPESRLIAQVNLPVFANWPKVTPFSH